MQGTIEEILANDPHVVRIEEPRFEVPKRKELDPQKLNSEWGVGNGKYRNLTGILKFSIIVDDFPSNTEGHYQRSAWKYAFNSEGRPDIYQFLEDNPLRESLMVLLTLALESMLKNYIGTDKKAFGILVDDCVSYFRTEMNDYYAEPVERKVEMVKELQDRTYKILTHLKPDTE